MKLLRTELGLTQEEMGWKFGVSTRTIAYWERTDRLPSPTVLRRISAKSGKPISWLLDLEDAA